MRDTSEFPDATEQAKPTGTRAKTSARSKARKRSTRQPGARHQTNTRVVVTAQTSSQGATTAHIQNGSDDTATTPSADPRRHHLLPGNKGQVQRHLSALSTTSSRYNDPARTIRGQPIRATQRRAPVQQRSGNPPVQPRSAGPPGQPRNSTMLATQQRPGNAPAQPRSNNAPYQQQQHVN